MIKKAFTFVEALVVIAIFATLTGLIVLNARTAQVRTDLNRERDGFISYLRLAQSNAMTGKDSEDHGIHIETDSYTTFTGTYSEGADGNFVIDLPVSLQFQNISLNGGGDDIIFSPPKGETTTYGTVDLYSEELDKSAQITINQLGIITY